MAGAVFFARTGMTIMIHMHNAYTYMRSSFNITIDVSVLIVIDHQISRFVFIYQYKQPNLNAYNY